MTLPTSTLEQQGDAFREARVFLGMTQTELAYRLGFAEATLRRWEAGRRRIHPAASQLLKIYLSRAQTAPAAVLASRLP
ncbi:MAG: helix-turn-helix domain-containing protein [Gemmatimonadaceae bacterium]|nr:helix-turn-helix domain-containing protein [Gemmatimonadaceae bacterium]